MLTSVAFFAWQISGAVRVTLKPTLKLRGRSWAFDDDDPHLHPKMSILNKVPVYSTGLCMYVRTYVSLQNVFAGWNWGLLRTRGRRYKKTRDAGNVYVELSVLSELLSLLLSLLLILAPCAWGGGYEACLPRKFVIVPFHVQVLCSQS